MIKVSHEFEEKSRRHRIVLRSVNQKQAIIYCEGPWFEYDEPAFLVDTTITYIAFTRFFEASLSVDVETPYVLSEIS